MSEAPNLFSVSATIYAPHESGEGYIVDAMGRFDIDLNEELGTPEALELLARFLVTMRGQHHMHEHPRESVVVMGDFPGLGRVAANGLGVEVAQEGESKG